MAAGALMAESRISPSFNGTSAIASASSGAGMMEAPPRDRLDCRPLGIIGGMWLPSAYSKAAFVAALAGACIGGCSSDRATPVLPAAAAARMQSYLAKVQASASAHDRAVAKSDLDAFASEAARQNAAGHMTQATYAALQTAIVRTRARIDAEVTRPPTPVSAAPMVAPGSTPSVPPQPVIPAASSPSGGGNGKSKDKPPKDESGGKSKNNGHGEG